MCSRHDSMEKNVSKNNSKLIKQNTMYYNKPKVQATSLNVNKEYRGESIEKKVRRITNNKEPIKDGAPLTYTDKKDGVQPDYDINTDRWEHAITATDKMTQAKRAKNEGSLGEKAKKNMAKEEKSQKVQDTTKDGETPGAEATNK